MSLYMETRVAGCARGRRRRGADVHSGNARGQRVDGRQRGIGGERGDIVTLLLLLCDVVLAVQRQNGTA